ncbi:PRC-barrel domain-containing protein [Methanobrevibacter filiformis]|uniref:PRC-barrel domain protein n=1 Tax=Methanobrevibacter filiformis TaxID=55758 RepID=A0A166CK46_9EURY|nr:PRC-barrel domain-containing protein [Methanobrevibacter filiformis]KZX14595.1 PRC-barrel domain protein [Methanobrevibacter filiformis]
MRIKHILGMQVVDRDARILGKVSDLDFDDEEGIINNIVISHKTGVISKDDIVINFNDIESIGDYILLKLNIKE